MADQKLPRKNVKTSLKDERSQSILLDLIGITRFKKSYCRLLFNSGQIQIKFADMSQTLNYNGFAMTKTSIPCYQPSGSFRFSTFLYFALATIAGVFISFIYQWLIRVIPFIYLNLLICIGFGVVLGLGGYVAVRRGHCRHRILGIILAIPLAVIPLIATYYWDYRYLVSVIAEDDKVESPPSGSVSSFLQEFPEYVKMKEEIGWRVGRNSGRGQTLNGKAIFLIWGIEAILILGSVYFVISSALRAPYCENCQRFCDMEKGRSLYGLSAEVVEPALEREGLNAIRNLPSSGSDAKHVIGLTCTYCSTCNQSAFLSVNDVWTYGTDKKGNPKTKTTELLNNAILSVDQRNQFLSQLDPKPIVPPLKDSSSQGTKLDIV